MRTLIAYLYAARAATVTGRPRWSRRVKAGHGEYRQIGLASTCHDHSPSETATGQESRFMTLTSLIANRHASPSAEGNRSRLRLQPCRAIAASARPALLIVAFAALNSIAQRCANTNRRQSCSRQSLNLSQVDFDQ